MKTTTQASGVMSVSVDAISQDTASQARFAPDVAVAEGYAEAMRDGVEFPPVVLYRDTDGALRVGDGWHRITAARLADKPTITAEIREGGLRDALACSIAANAHHGLPFSNRDKRRVVGLMLDDPEWSRLADREIARRCGVSQPFVGKLRAERRDNGYHPSADREPLTPAERARLAELTATIAAGQEKLRPVQEAVATLRRMLGPDKFDQWGRDRFGDRWLVIAGMIDG